jgi:hypothetical protein
MRDLLRELREMDQLVYQMQTAGSAEQLRSAVARAWAITEKRMRAESDRIGAIMEQEIRKTYIEPSLMERDAERFAKLKVIDPLSPPPKLIGKT